MGSLYDVADAGIGFTIFGWVFYIGRKDVSDLGKTIASVNLHERGCSVYSKEEASDRAVSYLCICKETITRDILRFVNMDDELYAEFEQNASMNASEGGSYPLLAAYQQIVAPELNGMVVEERLDRDKDVM